MTAEEKVKQVYPNAWYGKSSRAIWSDSWQTKRLSDIGLKMRSAWLDAWRRIERERREKEERDGGYTNEDSHR